ncbi:hypothetical protein RhiirA5_432235 [Rhizophagus irregularis]|uniref:Uncharacterized protein n=1 Tax=Rhizophagus irregularis TaxID=588596 RepID=A0A2N0NTS5_9GLOM|nr:hypothetical protein RhiirA5_432235 [Rhizophagus irregularis]
MVVSFLGILLFSDAFSVNIRNNNLISDVKIEDLKFLIYREISDEFKYEYYVYVLVFGGRVLRGTLSTCKTILQEFEL